MRRLVAVLAMLFACGDDKTPARPDANVQDATPDALVYAACREFAGVASSVPAHVATALAQSDVQSPMQCTTIDAPYGVESAGPDRVVPLEGLVPGTAYIVRLLSNADLAFYVVDGCSTATGPADSECKLFVDASAEAEEVGRFVASSATAFVVVDHYASATPTNQQFTLDVYAEACQDDAACTSGPPVCYLGRCVECADSFDCTQPTAPRCDPGVNLCGAGVDVCTADDATEPMNDGPSGAVTLVPDGGGAVTATAQICSSPRGESDYYKFAVTTAGETWDLSLTWTGARDLDLEVLDATGSDVGLSFWEQPETMRLAYLPIGTYYVRVTDFSTVTPASVDYTLAGQRVSTTACTVRAECAVNYRNQVFRGECTGGACVPITYATGVGVGGACDTEDDCAASLACPDFFFVANADTRSVCAPHCTSDSGCTSVGADYVCTTYLATGNFCIQKCTADDQCATDPSSVPLTDPWYRLVCQTSTGRCIFQ